MTENKANKAKEKPAEAAARAAEDAAADIEAAKGETTPWAGEDGPGEGADAPADPAAEIARLEAEKADLTDRLVRLAADMDNLRKRSEREAQDARKYAVSQFAGDMLVVGDNLRRALDAVPAERRESDEALRALVEGVEMTGREMERLLEKNGITRISAIGERFDPHRHQAMFEVEDPQAAPGTVVQVIQEGYQIADRVLRAAMVGVAKASPDAEKSAASEAAKSEAEA